MWKRLTHPNIVPLLGVTSTPLQLISQWMTGGALTEYIKKNPIADRVVLVGVALVVLSQRPLQSLAIRRREGSLLPSLLQYHSWGPQGSTWLFWLRLPTILICTSSQIFLWTMPVMHESWIFVSLRSPQVWILSRASRVSMTTRRDGLRRRS